MSIHLIIQTAEAPRGEQLVSSDEPDNKNDLPPDVQSLNDKINQLRGNISLIKAALVSIIMYVHVYIL